MCQAIPRRVLQIDHERLQVDLDGEPRWVEAHGRDVTRAAGIPGHGVLFEVTPQTVRASASARGGTTTPQKQQRSARSTQRRPG